MSGFDLPTHAYVPGKNTRHEEGAFDEIRSTAQAGMSVQALVRCDAYRVGLFYIENGYYWEAHEVLEPVWMALAPRAPEKQIVQGIIQLANAYLKVKMDRPKAALRLCDIAQTLIEENRESYSVDAPVAAIPRESYLEAIQSLRSSIR